jgi:hypothetical protein
MGEALRCSLFTNTFGREAAAAAVSRTFLMRNYKISFSIPYIAPIMHGSFSRLSLSADEAVVSFEKMQEEPRALSPSSCLCRVYLSIHCYSICPTRETPSSFIFAPFASVCKTARDSNQPNDECSKFFYRRRKKKKTLDVIPVNEDFIVFYVFGEEKNFTRGGSKQNLPQRDILFFLLLLLYAMPL